jgi:demethylmenaquinone methyltransferase / 2-methoxy-6-polyprenyl-1,4-benzoquinol methylase
MTTGEPARQGSGAMFDGIASRYDFMNRIISFGIDRRWRREAARATGICDGGRVLDLATGTGDLAIEIASECDSSTVVGVDPSPRMLDVARAKVKARSLGARIELVEGDAEHLPLEAASVDAITIAFGIRNVADRPRALTEMLRVVKPGGKIVILELTEPAGGITRPFARAYIHRLMPAIASIVTSSAEYRYLEASIAAFPAPARFAEMMTTAGMHSVEARPLTLGVAHLFIGERPES